MSSTQRLGQSSRAEKIVSSACEACRKSKTKCEGTQPCRTCLTKQIECVFDISKDGRRGRKRTLDQLYSQADALATLLESLKSSNSDSLQKLIELVRNDTPVDEVVSHLRAVLKETEQREKSQSRLRRTVLDIAALVDVPLIHVPARPWTNITRNDNDVSHLISVYFTWQHHGYPSVDQDTFVQAMRSKSLENKFCSPFLVTSMLAAACVYTDHPLAFADPDDRSSRGLHFCNEAANLWALEQETASLTSLQAMPAIITGSVAIGRDRVGLKHIDDSIYLAREFAIQVKKSRKSGSQEFNTPEFRRSYSLAQWAAFLIQTELTVAWARPFDLQRPVCEYPYLGRDLEVVATWLPYPNTSMDLDASISYFPHALTNERIKLYETAAELRSVVLSGNPQDSPLPGYIVLDRDAKLDQIEEVRSKLLVWYNNLPSMALLTLDAASLPEPLIDLHLAYHAFTVSTASQILRTTDITTADQRSAAETIISSSRSIVRIFKHRLRTTGLLYHGVYTGHAASVSAYALLEYLDQPDIPEIFHTLMVGLSATARRWTISRGIVKMISYEIQQRKLTHVVDRKTLDLIAVSAGEKWSAEDTRTVEKIAYPNYAALKEKGHALSEMGDLLGAYSRMELSEEGKETGREGEKEEEKEGEKEGEKETVPSNRTSDST